MGDTTAAAERVRVAAIRSIDPVDRMLQAIALSEWTRELALTRLRAAYPDQTDAQLVSMMLNERREPKGSPQR